MRVILGHVGRLGPVWGSQEGLSGAQVGVQRRPQVLDSAAVYYPALRLPFRESSWGLLGASWAILGPSERPRRSLSGALTGVLRLPQSWIAPRSTIQNSGTPVGGLFGGQLRSRGPSLGICDRS